MTAPAALTDAVSRYYRDPAGTDLVGLYAPLRGSAALVRTDLGFAVVGRYADAVRLLRDAPTARVPPAAATPGSGMAELFRHFFTTVDADTHRRMRRLVQRTFTARAVASLHDAVRATVADLLDAARARTAVDFVAEVAEPLPATVFAMLLGFPATDRHAVAAWVNAILGGYHPGGAAPAVTSADTAAHALLDYVRDLVRRKRAEPGTDLVSQLVGERDAGEALAEDELVGAVCHMLHAGIETTVTLLGNLGRLLLTEQAVADAVAADPAAASRLVEESLRLEPPVVSSPMRHALADVELSNGVLRAGERFTVWIGAANRDPEVFADPEAIDPGRAPNPHLAFSTGTNVCLGAHLSRLEGQVLATAVATGLTDYAPAGPTSYRDVAVVRSLVALPLTRRTPQQVGERTRT